MHRPRASRTRSAYCDIIKCIKSWRTGARPHNIRELKGGPRLLDAEELRPCRRPCRRRARPFRSPSPRRWTFTRSWLAPAGPVHVVTEGVSGPLLPLVLSTTLIFTARSAGALHGVALAAREAAAVWSPVVEYTVEVLVA